MDNRIRPFGRQNRPDRLSVEGIRHDRFRSGSANKLRSTGIMGHADDFMPCPNQPGKQQAADRSRGSCYEYFHNTSLPFSYKDVPKIAFGLRGQIRH